MGRGGGRQEAGGRREEGEGEGGGAGGREGRKDGGGKGTVGVGVGVACEYAPQSVGARGCERAWAWACA
jgi:hypothetical protein